MPRRAAPLGIRRAIYGRVRSSHAASRQAGRRPTCLRIALCSSGLKGERQARKLRKVARPNVNIYSV